MERKFEILPCVGLAERCPAVKRADKFAQEIEESANSLQQLKAEICAEMRDAVDNMQDGIADGLKSMVREWERKLSAV